MPTKREIFDYIGIYTTEQIVTFILQGKVTIAELENSENTDDRYTAEKRNAVNEWLRDYEEEVWKQAMDSHTIKGFQYYLDLFPDGQYCMEALEYLRQLREDDHSSYQIYYDCQPDGDVDGAFEYDCQPEGASEMEDGDFSIVEDFSPVCNDAFGTSSSPFNNETMRESIDDARIHHPSKKCELHVPDVNISEETGGSLIGSILLQGMLMNSATGGFASRFRKSNTVYSSVFAPAEISRGDDMMVQVYVYKDGERDQVILEAIKSDESASERKYNPLNFKLKIGDKVDVHLNIAGASIDRSVKSFVWQGKYTCCAFCVHVPIDYDRKKLFCEVFLTVNGATLGELMFTTAIANVPSNYGTASVISRLFGKVFISYAHADTDTVKHYAKAYELGKVKCFFDNRTLNSGDVYNEKIFDNIRTSDLFLLFWSKNAAASDYVKKEYQYAMQLAYPQMEPESATLSIRPLSIEPHAELPEDLGEIYHFGEI